MTAPQTVATTRRAKNGQLVDPNWVFCWLCFTLEIKYVQSKCCKGLASLLLTNTIKRGEELLDIRGEHAAGAKETIPN